MLEFLLALLATATVAALLWPLLRARPASTDRLAGELEIYRDQLAEIERERSAGTVSDPDAAAARLEIERRILAAADTADAAGPASESARLHRLLPLAIAVLVPLLALGVYLDIGRPGLPSAPFIPGGRLPAGPPMDIPRLVAEARARAAASPADAEAQAALGEALTLEADGTVTPAALEAFRKAIAIDAGDARSLYYLGLHEAQSGDSTAALARWRQLEARSPPDAPFLPMLRAEMTRVARAAGLPPPPAGQAGADASPQTSMPRPTREQQEAMAAMTPEQREQAIRGMVEGLAARLKENPQDREGWLRLANAWRVLGERASAIDAYARADALAPVDARILADWAEAHVRQLKPGEPPSPQAVAVLQRLERADPGNGLALFYLGAASFAAGDKAAAARRWKTLLSMLPADAPIRDMLEERIRAAEQAK
ncbi:MAG: c-type cytochrome biogenesis protein CcmI [Pseudomonadota bacterium]